VGPQVVSRPAEAQASRLAPTGFVFDTNVLYRPGELVEICRLARAAPYSLRLVVPTICYGERVRFLRQEYRDNFDEAEVWDFIRTNDLEVLHLALAHADTFADKVSREYPTNEDWQEAKRALCKRCLGLDTADVGTSPSHDCGATVDWFIAATAAAEGFVLVSDDKGPEFEICDRWSVDDALEWLRKHAGQTNHE